MKTRRFDNPQAAPQELLFCLLCNKFGPRIDRQNVYANLCLLEKVQRTVSKTPPTQRWLILWWVRWLVAGTWKPRTRWWGRIMIIVSQTEEISRKIRVEKYFRRTNVQIEMVWQLPEEEEDVEEEKLSFRFTQINSQTPPNRVRGTITVATSGNQWRHLIHWPLPNFKWFIEWAP